MINIEKNQYIKRIINFINIFLFVSYLVATLSFAGGSSINRQNQINHQNETITNSAMQLQFLEYLDNKWEIVEMIILYLLFLQNSFLLIYSIITKKVRHKKNNNRNLF